MTPRLSVLAALVGLAAVTVPALAPAMDLEQAWRDAVAIDPILASADAQLASVREKVPQARAGLLPTLNLNASASRQIADTNIAAKREFTTQNYALQLSYPVFRLQNTEAFEQSRLAVAVAEAQVAQARIDLMLRLSQAWFDVLGAQDSLRTLRAQKRAIVEQLASARRNFEVGTATITDQQEAQARHDLALAQELAAANDLEVKRAALSQLIGKPVPALKSLGSALRLQAPQPAGEAEWTSSARENNLQVQQARIATEIARRETDKQRYGHYPTLDLVGSTGLAKNAAVNFIGVETFSAAIGVQFSLPLYAGGATEARIRDARKLQDKAAYDLDTARRVAEQGARTAFLGVASGLAQVSALEAAEKSSQLALDSNLLGYQVGVRINIDVLNAQQQLFTTRRDLAKARYDVLLNGLRLKSSAGALSEADLAQVGSLLDTLTIDDPAR